MKYLFVSLLFLISSSSFANDECIDATEGLRASLVALGFHTIKPEPTQHGMTVFAESDHEIIKSITYISNPGNYTRTYAYEMDSETGETCNFSKLEITFKSPIPKVLSAQDCMALRGKYRTEEKKKYKLWHPFRVKKPEPKDDATLYGPACELAFTPSIVDDYHQE